MKSRIFVGVCCLTFCGLVTGSSAFCQSPEAAKKPSIGDQEEVKVFHLEFLNPDDAVTMLHKVFGPNSKESATATTPRFAADQRLKRVVARGDKDTLMHIEALLLSLDVKAERQDQPVIRTLVFKHAFAEAMQAAIQAAVPDAPVHVDRRTNTLIVTIPEDRNTRITELARLLDRPIEVEDVSLRIVWLVAAPLMKDGAPAVPTDLAGPIDALRKKIALGELRMAAQTIVRCTPAENSDFQTSGTANLTAPNRFDFQGYIRQVDAGQFRLQLSGSITMIDSDTVTSRLSTSVASMTVGKPVIIGTTTIDSDASVFVVQILDK